MTVAETVTFTHTVSMLEFEHPSLEELGSLRLDHPMTFHDDLYHFGCEMDALQFVFMAGGQMS